VHAIAHQLGGRYHVPHGLANAVMLPGVLRFSLGAARERLALLARHLRIEGAGDAEQAERFVDAVQALNDRLGIPRTLAALREEDIAELAVAACHEADHNYPVPRRMDPADAAALLRAVLPPPAEAAAASRSGRAARAAGRPARKRAAGAAASSKRAPLRCPVRRARRQHGDE
jgi:hypothetical protein